MALDIETADCTSLSEEDLEELVELCSEVDHPLTLAVLEDFREDWVLVTRVREGEHLRGFSFSTMERIGGTPCILIGLAYVRRYAKRASVLKAIMHANFHRALMAFPDEDVLTGSRMGLPDALEAYKTLHDIIPRPGHEANGEERQWGRRLAKRFKVPQSKYQAKVFVARGSDAPLLGLDYVSLKPEAIKTDVAELFGDLDVAAGDTLVVHGWAMAEDLLKYEKA